MTGFWPVIFAKSSSNDFNIFEAYYAGFELGRIVRIALKLIFFLITLFLAKVCMEAYLIFIK